MKSSWWYRFGLLVFVVVVSTMMVLPTFLNLNPEGKFPVKSKISLGLDLQGGLYMVLGIDFDKVYRDEVTGYMHKFEYTLKDIGIETAIGELNLSDPRDPKHSIIIKDPTKVGDAKAKIREYYSQAIRLVNEKDNILTYAIASNLKSQISDQAVSKSIEVIRNRIDEFGVAEPDITSLGSNRIVVQLPGVKDIDRAKGLIGKTAKLEFKLVNSEMNPMTLRTLLEKAEKEGKIVYQKGMRFSDYLFEINQFLKKDLPAGYEVAFQRRINAFTNQVESQEPFLVESHAQLGGDDLQDANVQIDPQKNMPLVSMTFKPQGAKRFEEITDKSKGKQLAVILDGNIYTAPQIRERIAGGRAQITLGHGGYNELLKQARDIALVLRAGALPVQLDFEEQRIVGPSLGSDSIAQAQRAGIIGVLAVFLFMMIYYRMAGVLAVVVLCINVLMILATLVGLEATLTLPGIGGIVLTVGMAVDASIIIYERIREELKRNIGPLKAMEEGFQHAFWTIVDANITTAMAALCLLNFGTGPVRGFAVTTLIGLVATVYTGYFVGKLLFELYLHLNGGKKMSI